MGPTVLRKLIILGLALLLPFPLPAQLAADGYTYDQPHLLDFIKKVPCDLVGCTENMFSPENRLAVGAVVATTGILLIFDQDIVDGAQHTGNQLGISHNNNPRNFHSFPYPYDWGSALYYIGDGATDVVIAGGFLATGLITSDNRELQTASQITESIIATGIATQALKHVTGRESPYVATHRGGRWQPLPNPTDYGNNVPNYDAFPSGHLAAGMATVTVIAENYSDYKFIRPVGYTAMGALGWQMLNNGVHWASDYPLAIALGYMYGRMASRRGRHAKSNATTDSETNFSIMVVDNSAGVGLRRRF